MPKGFYPEEIKQKAFEYRLKGYSYIEIQSALNCKIPKSTLSTWFKRLELSDEAKSRIINKIRESGTKGRAIAWEKIRQKRINLLSSIRDKANTEIHEIDKHAYKLILASLYMGEGGKTNEFIRLGNSDPKIIEIFVTLLRKTFDLQESRFRGKVQCRADQEIKTLERYWSRLSKIPLSQFQKAQIDKRTVGIPTKRLDYKGVFVVEYYSNALFLELMYISDIIYNRVV